MPRNSVTAGTSDRIQIFDQEGEGIAEWFQVRRPSGICFDANARIDVADSESDNARNPGWELGIRAGDAATGSVESFIRYPWGDPRNVAGPGAELVAADNAGNLYGAEPWPNVLPKYPGVHPWGFSQGVDSEWHGFGRQPRRECAKWEMTS